MHWTPPNFPEDAIRTELHLSGSPETIDFLRNLIVEIDCGVDHYSTEEDMMLFVYSSPEIAQSLLGQLYEKLCAIHPDLIGHPAGVSFDSEAQVLYFKKCEVFVV